MAIPEGLVRSVSGGAVETTLSTAINDTVGDIIADDASSYPLANGDGVTTAKWAAIKIAPGEANEEVIWYSPRSGNTFQNCIRGADGTQAFAHAVGEKIQHVVTALDISEANAHAFNDSRDDHNQYLHISTDRTSSATVTWTDDQIIKGDEKGLIFQNSAGTVVGKIGCSDVLSETDDLIFSSEANTRVFRFFMAGDEKFTITNGTNYLNDETRFGSDVLLGTSAFLRLVTENASTFGIITEAPGAVSSFKFRAKGDGAHYFTGTTNDYWGSFDYVGNTPTISETSLTIRQNNTIKRVYVGATNSGGTGFRLLRVEN